MSKKNLDTIEIGNRLKKVRKSIDLTLNDIKEISGFSIPTISDIERGKNKPNLEYLLLLAEKFNVNLNWVLTGKGAMFDDFDITWGFGKDNEIVKELIYLLENSPSIRFTILQYFVDLKESKKETIESVLSKMREDKPSDQ